jgi:hypothetical protein
LTGLFLGVPLWGMGKILTRLVPELILFVTRIGRSPWAGEAGWGEPLEAVVCYLLWRAGAFMGFMLGILVLAIRLDPNTR